MHNSTNLSFCSEITDTGVRFFFFVLRCGSNLKKLITYISLFTFDLTMAYLITYTLLKSSNFVRIRFFLSVSGSSKIEITKMRSLNFGRAAKVLFFFLVWRPLIVVSGCRQMFSSSFCFYWS